MAAVEIEGATKAFRDIVAVDNLSLEIPHGSIYGLIGPNGSGKTSTMRMIAGIFFPDSGSVRVFGSYRAGSRSSDIGYLPEERGVYRKMTVGALLEFHGELRAGRRVAGDVAVWLARLGMTDWIGRRIESLSKGMSQKVQFLAAVIPEPKLLILDEPFSGLDPVSADSIRAAILDMRARGVSIILSTHDMSTAESLCDSICMMFRGRKVLDGSLMSIQQSYGADTVSVRVDGGADMLTGLPGVQQVRDLGRFQELRLHPASDTQRILAELIDRTRVHAFTVTQPSLHDIFVRIAGPPPRPPMLNRIFLIARRDFVAAVMTKAFLFGLLLLPLVMGGLTLATVLATRGAGSSQTVAILDRSGSSAAEIVRAAERRQLNSSFRFELAPPQTKTAEQLLAFSDRIRNGTLAFLLEIPADTAKEPVRFYTNTVNPQAVTSLTSAVNDGIRRSRLLREGIPRERVETLMLPVTVSPASLLSRNSVTGKIEPAAAVDRVRALVVPLAFTLLLLLMIMLGSAQKLGAIAEDKMQRVFEMLLVSASPFEIMMGKVLATVGVSLTGSAFYMAGALVLIVSLADMGMAPLHLLPWFIVYLIGDVVILSALGAALGSACGTPQDAQHFQFLLILPVMIPVSLIRLVMERPNGFFATVVSFIPPFTPLVMLFRQALPGGVPWWQPWVGLLGIAACAVLTVWAASRVFRIGILAQGTMPRLGELGRWVVRG